MWIYQQQTGTLTHNGSKIGEGYSGTGHGRNNPAAQQERGIGPIPQGRYLIGQPIYSPTCGPHAIPLIPSASNAEFGRSGFLLHGDNCQHDASHGCIVMALWIRQEVTESRDENLLVIA